MAEAKYTEGLATPIRYLKGVGEVRAEQLARLEVRTVGDLLLTVPRRYEDRRTFEKLASLQPGDMVVATGTIMACGWVKARFGRSFFEALIRDDSGLACCRWYNAQYLQDQLKTGDTLVVYGKVTRFKGQMVFQHPEFEMGSANGSGAAPEEESLHLGRIVPIYPLTEHLGQRTMRRIAWNAVTLYAEKAEDMLPGETLDRLRLPGIREALARVHFPASLDEARAARYRIVFDEFLCIQLVLVARKVHAEQFLTGPAHVAPGHVRRRFLSALPFELTEAQQRVLKEIEADMQKPRPMHRLLQGDVGSGKTIVAACAILDAIECGSQCAVMAPTEILASQHARTFTEYLEPLGLRIALLTSDMPAAERTRALDGIRVGDVNLVVGTHAIIEERVAFKKLGFIVIDEQHKFGVEQRGVLYEKGENPDVLVMTATPIPRTLAMTIYGDLDVSILDEMPKGRQEIVTRVIKEEQLPQAYDFIRKQVAKGRQAYLVYPLVSAETIADETAGAADQPATPASELRAAEEMYRKLKETVFTKERLGLLHGQMRAADKGEIMQRFRRGELDLLVATTVVEVGIDVPNATVMLVENAERFGLAQLHQLRGRIGRGAHKSFCILEGRPGTPESWRRLKVMEETLDGFRIAEEDLKIRGMGNLLGREQSGFPALRVGDPLGDSDILMAARDEAFRIVGADPRLEDPRYDLLRRRARELYKLVGPFVKVG
ncbi:MAG: ATP-dependent DNA helicase RecG [Verrucomicrobiota bacterium]